MIMTRIKLGVVIAVCTSVVMSMVSFGSVKDDLTALEQEAGIETDEDASISSRLSALEEELSIAVEENALDNISNKRGFFGVKTEEKSHL